MFLKTLSMLPKKLRRSTKKKRKEMKSIPPPKKKEKESQDDPAPREEKCSYPPREESSSYASSEELSVHNESLDKKRSIDQFPVPEKYMSRPEEIQRRMKKIPERKDPSTQMCSRSRQKSFLPEKNLQAEMSRSLSRTHVDRVTITKLFRRRLSADKCRGTPMWIGLSSQVLRGRVSETWAHNRYPPRTRMLSRSWIPSRRSDHPSRGLSVVSSPQLLRDEKCYAAEFRPAKPR